jgi:malate synthase
VAEPALYEQVRSEELAKLGGPGAGHFREAAEILDELVGAEEFVEFLTLPAYRHLE